MNPVQDNVQKNQNVPQSTAVGVSKEHEGVGVTSSESVVEVSHEMEIPEEVEKAGVTKFKDTIELPPDVKKLGVIPSGSSIPVASTTVLPQVVLPISDQKVVEGLHSSITSAFKWLSIWCLKKLKKAHVALKVIHGKITRTKIK